MLSEKILFQKSSMVFLLPSLTPCPPVWQKTIKNTDFFSRNPSLRYFIPFFGYPGISKEWNVLPLVLKCFYTISFLPVFNNIYTFIYTLGLYVDRLGGWARVTWVYGRKWPDCYQVDFVPSVYCTTVWLLPSRVLLLPLCGLSVTLYQVSTSPWPDCYWVKYNLQCKVEFPSM